MSHRYNGILSGGVKRGRPSHPRRDDDAAAAPVYEPLEHPLTVAAQRELAAIANGRDTRKYEAHLGKCTLELRTSVGAINDRLRERRQEATAAAKRKRDPNDDAPNPSASQVSVTAEALNELEGEVIDLTSQLEKAAREVIDLQAGLQDELASLAEVKTQIGQIPRAPRPRRNVDAEEGDDEEMPDAPDEVPTIKTRDVLAKERRARTKAYTDLSILDKYCRNNEYISFKKMLHDAQNPDGVVPDPSNWFDSDGQPVLHRSVVGDEEDEEEEELEVVGVKQSFRCPLTQAVLVKPFTSKVCQHTFEKQAILDFVKTNGPKVHCPQTGCAAVSLPRLPARIDQIMHGLLTPA
jgi:E3 SUMO-protein ligase NSE2